MAEPVKWREAIRRVLSESLEPMHYERIAEEIETRQLRSSLGATPANTVNAEICDSLKRDGAQSIFERIGKGVYRLRAMIPTTDAASPKVQSVLAQQTAEKEALLADDQGAEDPAGLINAFGMYWSRDRVIWNAVPKLLGKQSASSLAVNFTDQRGVYLLYDRSTVIYVGRTVDQGIGTRLRQHTTDRLNGRWDRFSWFGIYAVSAEGRLETKSRPFTSDLLIATMEALLIESVEPAQNRRRGDDFKAVEFLQADDPEIKEARVNELTQMFRRQMLS